MTALLIDFIIKLLIFLNNIICDPGITNDPDLLDPNFKASNSFHNI